MCWNMGRKQQRAKAPVLKRRRRVNLVVEEEEVGGGADMLRPRFHLVVAFIGGVRGAASSALCVGCGCG